MRSIETNIKEAIDTFCETISAKYGLRKSELLGYWDTEIASDSISVRSAATNGTSGLCPHIVTRGDRKGDECGLKSVAGKVYCSKHKASEGKSKAPIKLLPTVKKPIISPSKVKPNKSPQLLIRKHKELGVLYHPETNMVMHSAMNTAVCGKIVDDKVVNKLDDDDLKICMQYGFKIYDPNTDVAEAIPRNTGTTRKQALLDQLADISDTDESDKEADKSD